MKTFSICGAASLLGISMLASCAIPNRGPEEVQVYGQFNKSQAESLLRPGAANIKGNAFMRQVGGGVVTCAGSEVDLIPATNYATMRIRALYGNEESGFSTRAVKFIPDDPDYRYFTKKITCDSQGNFEFSKVADGEFFVITKVLWRAGDTPQGGGLMKRVLVESGKDQSIVITRQ